MWETILFFLISASCLAVFCVRWRYLSRPLHWIGIAHAVNMVSICFAQLLSLSGWKNNLFISHVSILFLYAAYATAFYHAVAARPVKRAIHASIYGYVLFSVSISLTIQPMDTFNTYSRMMICFLLTVLALIYLYELFTKLTTERLEQNPFFWVSAGLMFTSLGSFFAYGFMDYLIKKSLSKAQQIYVIIEVMRYLLMLILLVAAYTDKLFPHRQAEPLEL